MEDKFKKRKIMNKHLNTFDRRWLAFALRDSYMWMKVYESNECICEEKGKSDGLIDMGFVTGIISKLERDRYRKAFWNLYTIKRGWRTNE